MARSNAHTFSWILIAIAFWDKDEVSAEEIVHSADAIDHSIPSELQMRSALDFLTHHGLIDRFSDCFSVTPSGRQLLEEAQFGSGNIFDTWKALEQRVATLSAA